MRRMLRVVLVAAADGLVVRQQTFGAADGPSRDCHFAPAAPGRARHRQRVRRHDHPGAALLAVGGNAAVLLASPELLVLQLDAGDHRLAYTGIRSMANPELYGDPDHYSRRYRGSEDNGGVHTNSGIANQARYLAIEGGTNRISGMTVQDVGSAQREQMDSTFAIARAATLQAARDLYGPGSAPEGALTQAWTAVGVN